MKKILIKDKKIKDLSYTLGANIISLISGIIATFMIPKLLTIEEYAYLRIFTFYAGYLGIFHLGFNDGIYLKYGKFDFEELPKEKFRIYFKFFFIFQTIVAVLMFIIVSIFTKDKNRLLIYLFLSINIIIVNIIGYFDFISQFVRKFNIYSFNIVLSKTLYIFGVILFLFINSNSGVYFIVLQTVINILILCIYLLKYKEIIIGKSESFKEAKKDIKDIILTGSLIMIGTFISIIILGIDRMFVDKFFTIKDFAMYSFAVSLLSMFYLILNAITTVIYPYLTRSNNKDKGKMYESMKSFIFILLGFSISAYYIFDIIVKIFIPQYKEALKITSIIFPTILLSGQINIVTQNYYKTLKLQKEYAKNNIVAVLITLVTIIIAFIFFRSINSIAISSLISFYIWEIYGDRFFKKFLGINTTRHHIAELLTISLFIFITFNFKPNVAFILYILIFLIIVLTFFRKDMKEIKIMLMKKI